MSALADKLKESFQSSEYRHGYADEFLNSSIATQIKVLREQRDWTQQQLAEKTGMQQARISVLENVNYSSHSITTLRRIAEAYDLTLNVSFEEFGKRLTDIDRFSRESLERFSFEEDPVFQKTSPEEILQSRAFTESVKGDAEQEKQECRLKEGNLLFLDAHRKRLQGAQALSISKGQEPKDSQLPMAVGK